MYSYSTASMEANKQQNHTDKPLFQLGAEVIFERKMPMKTRWMRILSLCLVLVLLCGMFPQAMAAKVDTTPPDSENDATIATEPMISTEEAMTVDETQPAENTMPLIGNDGIMLLADDGNPEGYVYKNGLIWASDSSKEFDVVFDGVTQRIEKLSTYAVKHNGTYEPCYCIAPGIPYEKDYGYTANEWTTQDAWDALTEAERRAIGLALIYGYPNGITPSTSLDKKGAQGATQMIIWEICYGMRNANYPYSVTDNRFIGLYNADSVGNEFTDGASGAGNGTVYNLNACYNEISSKMAAHSKVPSFTTTDSSFAQTYELNPNGDGTYSVTLTDSNNILSECTFTNTNDLTFYQSGNTLTIKANKAISEVTVKASKNVPNINSQTFIIWTYQGKQTMAQPIAPTNDPLPIYFKLKVSSGNLSLKKTTEDGKNLGGWKFGIYSDQACTTLISGPHITDASGNINVSGLTAGTMWVKELGNTDSTINALYTCASTNPQKVTIASGQTTTVAFHNTIRTGKCQIIKATTNGGTKAGWHFEVKNSSGTVVGNYVTDTTGIITLDLKPGTYTVTETDGEYEYWNNDPSPSRTVTVKAGETAKLTFQNQWVGKARIVKTSSNDGTVKGWEFTITDTGGNIVGTYTTDATGSILVELNPGTYIVQETDRNDIYWYCDTEPQTVTVKAGETATVTFHNQWIGKVKIIKTLANPEAGNVDGWTFDIYKVATAGTAISADYLTTVTTGADGIILQDLEPGEYLITEKLKSGSLWECITEKSQTVIVEAGKTAEVSFTNALRPGKICIQKVDTKGEVLNGVEFLLEWSEDGINWSHVAYTDSTVPQIGTCTTEGLTDGKLVSDMDGFVTFSGLYPTLQYRLTETATRDGYQLLTDYAYVGGLSVENDLTVNLTVVNAEIFTLPQTGSKSLLMLPLSISLCLGLCISAIVYLRKKEG